MMSCLSYCDTWQEKKKMKPAGIIVQDFTDALVTLGHSIRQEIAAGSVVAKATAQSYIICAAWLLCRTTLSLCSHSILLSDFDLKKYLHPRNGALLVIPSPPYLALP